MKWIEELPDGFSKEFVFRAEGVDNADEWLTKNMGLGEKDWGSPVSLGREELLKSWYLRETLTEPDVLKETPIEFTYKKDYILEDGIKANECFVIGALVKIISLAGQKELTVVPDLSSYRKLKTLNLAFCEGITDLSPLSALLGLSRLNLAMCMGITDLSPLSALQELSHLDLEECKGITDLGPLSALQELSHLDLEECKGITDLGPLSALQELSHLDLGECKGITDLGPLSALQRLSSLSLKSCKGITDLGPLSALQRLSSLSLKSCKGITDLGPLSALQGLSSLDLSNCHKITDLSPLSALQGLSSLNLEMCEGIRGLGPLSALHELSDLNLYCCEGITDLSPLSALQGLSSLNLEMCEGITDLSPLSAIQGLSSLNLSSCNRIKDLSPLSALQGLSNLDLSSCKGITDLGPLSALQRLSSLSLKSCKGITDLGPLSALQRLSSLSLKSCKGITDLGPLSALKDLSNLDFSFCEGITDIGPISAHKGLAILNLYWCEGITDLSPLAAQKALKNLNVQNCPTVNIPSNWQSLAGITSLKYLYGIQEPFQTHILWQTALLRSDKVKLQRLKNDALKLCANEQLQVNELKADLIKGLELLRLLDEDWKEIYAAVSWNLEDWAKLLKVSDNALDPLADEFELPAEEMGLQLAAGFIRAVALGAGWDVANGHLKRLLSDFGSMELWNTSATDMLLALRNLGMQAEEEAFLKRFTGAEQEELSRSAELKLAIGWAQSGQTDRCLQLIDRGDFPKEDRLLVLQHLLKEPLSALPEQLAQWLLELSEEPSVRALLPDLSTEKNLQDPELMKRLLLMQYSDRNGFMEFLQRLASAVPDSPWVASLLAEFGSEGANDSKEAVQGLSATLRSDSLQGMLGPLMGQQLQAATDGVSEEELHRLATALLLEYYGVVTAQMREQIIELLGKQSN